MNYNSLNLPEGVRRLLPASEKKRLGIAAFALEELLLKQQVKKETGKGGLQDLIRQYLNLHAIPTYGNASHKKSTAVKGQPDFLLCVRGRFIGLEAKHDSKPTEAQLKELENINANGGIGRVVTSLAEVKALLFSNHPIGPRL